jgi:hypothetical protein
MFLQNPAADYSQQKNFISKEAYEEFHDFMVLETGESCSWPRLRK